MPVSVYQILVGAGTSAGFEGHCRNRFKKICGGTAGSVPVAVQAVSNNALSGIQVSKRSERHVPLFLRRTHGGGCSQAHLGPVPCACGLSSFDDSI